jgi:lysozyme
MRKRYAALALIIGTVLSAATLFELLDRGYVQFNNPSAREFPVRGLDVSHHQGTIDWNLLAHNGIQFAYMKASEGATFRDNRFSRNWAGARKAGIVPGAYHYYSLCVPPALQAANFLASAPPSATPALPPAVDLEFAGNCSRKPTPAAFQADLHVFLDSVQAAWKRPVVLYVTSDFYPYVEGKFNGNPLWVRSIFGRPSFEGFGQWQFWQYANRGRLDGVSSLVDLNVSNLSQSGFQALIAPPPHTAPVH